MTDYSQLSDFEINKRVAEALLIEHFANEIEQVIETINGEHGYFNPCNDPADAWPIISEHCIDIYWEGDSNEPQLRYAMIVYLKMRESDG